jgi:uncharacterized protein (TIRG00374 family)
MTKKTSKHLKITIGIMVTIFFLWYALRGISFDSLMREMKNADYRTLPLILLVLVIFFWIKAWRWKLLLYPLKKFTTYDVMPAMMVGFMGNNILPMHLGEIMRVMVLGKQYELNKSAVFSTVVLERVMDVFAILFCLVVGIFLLPTLPLWVQKSGWGMGITGAVLMIFMGIYIKWTQKFIDFFEKYFTFLPNAIYKNISNIIESGAHGLESLKDPRLLLGNIASSILHWMVFSIAVYLSLVSFNIRVPFASTFIVNAVSAIGVTIPASPGFFGIIQTCYRESLALFGVDETLAVAASMYFHIINYLPVTAVGLFYLSRLGLTLAEVEREAEETEIEELEGAVS